MSFADRAYKTILKQYKKEGKELKLYPESCNTGFYKNLDEKFAQFDGNLVIWADNPLEKKTVPEIIDSLKKYYLSTGDSLSGPIVSEPPVEYKKENDFVLRQSTPPGYRKHEEILTEESHPLIKLDISNLQFQRAFRRPEEKTTHDKVIDELEKALKDYYENPGNTVSDFLIKKIRESNLKASEIYNPVYMSKQNYSKIISNQTKNPQFEACIQFAFGLKLNLEDTTELLRLAGNAFSDSPYHRIVKLFIEKKKYDMYELNKCLDKFGLEPIGNIMH